MFRTIYETAFKLVLKFLGGITSDQWDQVKALVAKAATDFVNTPGADKRAWVVDEIKKLWGDMAPYLVNLLVDGAFGLLRNAALV